MRPAVLTTCAAAAALATIVAAPAAAAPPAACQNLTQIADVPGDGHHPNTDLVSGWFSEQAGLQAVLRPKVPSWAPVHDDSDAAGFALLYEVGGERRYVRAEAPRTGDMRYDHGAWSLAGGFASAGATTGRIDAGTVVIDVPVVAPGTKLTRPFALTYDGFEPSGPHWVDRAPGGVTPAGDEYGADLVVGACALGAGGATAGSPGTTDGGGSTGGTAGTATGTSPNAVTAVRLTARRSITGRRTVRVTGSVAPARAGVAVTLRAQAAKTISRRTLTRSDGSFTVPLALGETTKLRASAEGISSQTVTVTVRSKVRVQVRRTRSGGAIITGRVWPSLAGRVLWLRDGAARPTATTTVRESRFRLRFSRPTAGRYQAVFIPFGRRAERSTSNTGVIR